MLARRNMSHLITGATTDLRAMPDCREVLGRRTNRADQPCPRRVDWPLPGYKHLVRSRTIRTRVRLVLALIAGAAARLVSPPGHAGQSEIPETMQDAPVRTCPEIAFEVPRSDTIAPPWY